MLRILVYVEVITGIIAILVAGSAFVNLTWAEGASSQKTKRESARRSRRLFIIAGAFAVVCGLCAYLATRAGGAGGGP